MRFGPRFGVGWKELTLAKEAGEIMEKESEIRAGMVMDWAGPRAVGWAKQRRMFELGGRRRGNLLNNCYNQKNKRISCTSY